MKSSYIVMAFAAITQALDVDHEVLSKRTSCSTPYGSGTCVSTSSCGGFHVSGYCPGSSSIQCCISTECSAPSGKGVCRNTAYGCSGGSFVSGYCPGDSTIQCCVGPSCTTPDGSGTCKDTSACGTFSESGACPGPSSFQCCVAKSCSTPKGNGNCKDTSKGCSGGSFLAGYCPGASNVQCCVANAAPAPTSKKTSTTAKPPSTTKTTAPPPPTSTACAELAGFDVSGLQGAAFWAEAKNTKTKAVIQGYQEGCVSGGNVNANFAQNYADAVAAKFTNIDAYFYPCTGVYPASCGRTCKPVEQQFQEFEAAVAAAAESTKVQPGHLWLDIDYAVAADGCACGAQWNGGAQVNIAQQGQYVDLMRKSTYKWGIYANGNTWSGIFGTRDFALAPDMLLWAVQADNTPGVSTTTTFMGGWNATRVFAKQYSTTTPFAGGSVDFDSFCG